jgi:hypothetical protein
MIILKPCIFVFNIFLLIYSAAGSSAPPGLNLNTPDQFILEEIPVGSLIIDLADFLQPANNTAQSQRSSTLTTVTTVEGGLSDNDEQYFTFLDDSKTSHENIYFILDSTTGRLTSKRFLDRESMCLNKHCANNCQDESDTGSCRLSVKVLAIPSYKILNTQIIVQDINDHRPVFRTEHMHKVVAENLPAGHRIPVELAVDPDAGLNAVHSYTLVNSSRDVDATFSLVFEEAERRLYLQVKRRLDREERAEYNLTLVACDAGVPQPLCGQTSLVLALLDQNDNNPEFERSLYSFWVS